MTAYFDEAAQEVAAVTFLSGKDFLARLEAIEARVVHDVSLCTGDREFPDERREQLMSIIACSQCRVDGGVPTQGRHVSLVTRSSYLIAELHLAFHRVAAARIETRFGTLTDDPAANVRMRDHHDIEELPWKPASNCSTPSPRKASTQ